MRPEDERKRATDFNYAESSAPEISEIDPLLENEILPGNDPGFVPESLTESSAEVSPDISSEVVRRIKEAQDRAGNVRLISQLGEGFDTLGRGISGASKGDPSFYRNIGQSADQEVENELRQQRVMAQIAGSKARTDAAKATAASRAQEAKTNREFLFERDRRNDESAMERAKVGAGVRAANQPTDKNLGLNEKRTIETLSAKNALKVSISNQIDAVMSNWDALSETEKIQQGKQLLKTLNSPEGADAIGAEEAKRLGAKLEIGLGGLSTGNYGQFGRDVDGFASDAKITSDNLKKAIAANQKIIDSASGRKSNVRLPEAGNESGFSQDKQKRLEELRAKRAAGTLGK